MEARAEDKIWYQKPRYLSKFEFRGSSSLHSGSALRLLELQLLTNNKLATTDTGR
jgi:hypothetical protein